MSKEAVLVRAIHTVTPVWLDRGALVHAASTCSCSHPTPAPPNLEVWGLSCTEGALYGNSEITWGILTHQVHQHTSGFAGGEGEGMHKGSPLRMHLACIFS